MDQESNINKLLIPLEVLTFEGLADDGAAIEEPRTVTCPKTESPSSPKMFPPIACATTAPKTNSSDGEYTTVGVNGDQGLSDSFHSSTQLPQIKVELKPEEQTKPTGGFPNPADEARKYASLETLEGVRVFQSPDILKKEVVSLRNSLKRELENARTVILDARIACMAGKTIKRNTKRKVGIKEVLIARDSNLPEGGVRSHKPSRQRTNAETARVVKDLETAVGTTDMTNTECKRSKINKMGKSVKEGRHTKCTEQTTAKGSTGKLEMKSQKDATNQRISSGNKTKRNCKDNVVNSRQICAKISRGNKNYKTLQQTKICSSKITSQDIDNSAMSGTKNCPALVNITDWQFGETRSNITAVRDVGDNSTRVGEDESDSHGTKQEGGISQEDKRNMEMAKKERKVLEKRYRVPRDEQQIIKELYKLQRTIDAENLRDLVETKFNAEINLKCALVREKEEAKLEQQRKEREYKERRENEIKTIERRKRELEQFELARNRVELLKRREQNLLLLDEEKKTEIARRISRSFSFSYFPPLPECRPQVTVLDVFPPPEPSVDNFAMNPQLLCPPPTPIESEASFRLPAPTTVESKASARRSSSVANKGTMKQYGSYHSNTQAQR